MRFIAWLCSLTSVIAAAKAAASCTSEARIAGVKDIVEGIATGDDQIIARIPYAPNATLTLVVAGFPILLIPDAATIRLVLKAVYYVTNGVRDPIYDDDGISTASVNATLPIGLAHTLDVPVLNSFAIEVPGRGTATYGDDCLIDTAVGYIEPEDGNASSLGNNLTRFLQGQGCEQEGANDGTLRCRYSTTQKIVDLLKDRSGQVSGNL